MTYLFQFNVEKANFFHLILHGVLTIKKKNLYSLMHFYQPNRELRIYQCHDIRILDLIIFEFVLKIQGVMKL